VTFAVQPYAATLTPGSYTATISFTNTTNNQGSQTRTATLTVAPPPAGALQVSPATDMDISGTQGGPFSPSSAQYQVSSTSGSVSYAISGLPGWLDASPASGTATAAPTNVTFTVQPYAATLAPGSYTTTIGFTNTTNNQGSQTRTATLTISALTPAQQIAALGATVQSFNLIQGVENSLDSKLDAAQAALAAARANSVGTACNQLGAFLNYTQAQAGQKLTQAQADQLISFANQIRASLGCS
jgi:hypothetical protein